MARSEATSKEPAVEEVNREVYAARGGLVEVSSQDVALLRARARDNAGRKCRMLLHPGEDDSLHEMVIVHSRGQYIRPHLMDKTSKSYHVVDGAMILVLFNADGTVGEHVLVGDYASGKSFMVRVMARVYHTVVPVTDTVAFIETVPGPWSGTTFADWAPAADGDDAANEFYKGMLTALRPMMLREGLLRGGEDDA